MEKKKREKQLVLFPLEGLIFLKAGILLETHSCDEISLYRVELLIKLFWRV